MFPQVQEFSAGYYILSPMYVEPHDVETPRVNDRLYQFLQSEILDGFERVILKCEARVFEVEPSRAISPETLAAPGDFVRGDLDMDAAPEEVTTFVAKGDIAEKILGIPDDRRVRLLEYEDEE
ncbi:hypothetical protein DNAM5_35 [Haloarcula californiae tailed virus 1]|uniref:Uncharacterized protein n=1 Tax=Haloarcula californiae tailed virus 1 TaxID=1273746 RepID=R4TNV3_9CAUD|nr:hypothetical protein M202_gp035 [Haloarcula californiae tailed virus 1]AGM11898.1 hypothetical protein DNAM5_35 [Haloarcula californiae tailed virus 1]UBF23020.1 hypothetical protein HCTV-16_gp37 [Haloarcula virus HCTV-16]